MALRIGVIAEDHSDIDVFEEITRKISKKDFVLRKFVGRGCGKIKKECAGWAQNLRDQNCSLLVLIHDLDENDLTSLEKQLTIALHPSPIKNNLIVIPVKEIEAWLLSDEVAIKSAMNIKVSIPAVGNPESIDNPKEYLERLVEKKTMGKKHYLNTTHNKKIAALLNLAKVKKCKSFLPLELFLNRHLAN
ncbi:MAG TPA: DUF4276 family protein [Anaerolineales bacterium]|nr:DUF4276 family protein [Anaerolineales bacterium]